MSHELSPEINPTDQEPNPQEKESDIEIFDSRMESDEWMSALEQIYGPAHTRHEYDSTTAQEFVRIAFTNHSTLTAYHLSVSRALRDENPRFRVDLKIAKGERQTAIYTPSVRSITVDPNRGMCEFRDDGRTGEDVISLELSNTGKYLYKTIEPEEAK